MGKIDRFGLHPHRQRIPAQATGWLNGDFNYDGAINGSDYTLIDNAFNTQGASLAAQVAPKRIARRNQPTYAGTFSSSSIASNPSDEFRRG